MLDYLSKYCILSQAQTRQYQLVFNNVDLNKDGLITINELDFGLKTVNRSLMNGKQIDYVKHILEITPNSALNFRLFSVIAAYVVIVVYISIIIIVAFFYFFFFFGLFILLIFGKSFAI